MYRICISLEYLLRLEQSLKVFLYRQNEHITHKQTHTFKTPWTHFLYQVAASDSLFSSQGHESETVDVIPS